MPASPSETDLQPRLIDLARRAGERALARYGRVEVRLKPDRSVVTEVDLAVERLLRRELEQIDPDAVFIGEESARDPDEVARARGAERVWVVDPIDGSAAYVAELDTFCVCIAQLRDGQPHAGVVHLPALGQCYSALAGAGARWSSPRGEQLLDAAAVEHYPEQATCLLLPSSVHRWQARLRYPGKVRSLGSTAYHFVLVARGVGVGALSVSHIWDWAAAAAVLQEAGARMAYLDGSELDWRALMDGVPAPGPALAAHPGRWPQVRAAIEP